MERFVGDTWDRKDWEYTVVAKVPHASKEGVYVYMVTQRKFGSDDMEYIIIEELAEKYHVFIKIKEDNRVVWKFTKNSVSKAEAEKIAEKEKEGLNDLICYMSIEKE